MKKLLILMLFCFTGLAPVPAISKAAPGNPEIEALITRVGQSAGMVFIRNGQEYSAAQAAAHLRRKLRAANGRIRSAEAFIDHIGTRSSLSGHAYRVRLPDGRQLDSAPWLYGLLHELRAQKSSKTQKGSEGLGPDAEERGHAFRSSASGPKPSGLV